jgi:hypothetical protein
MSKSRFVGAIIIISYSPTLPKDHQKQSKCRSMIPRLGGSPHLKRVHIDGPSLVAKPAELKRLGGSCSDIWNSHIANQAIDTLRSPKSDNGEATTETKATIVGLAGINPRDEIEGMLAAQLIAGHNAAMECYRLVASPNIGNELRSLYLNSLAHLRNAPRHAQSPSRQRATEGHRRARSRSQGRSGNRGQYRSPGEGFDRIWRNNPTQAECGGREDAVRRAASTRTAKSCGLYFAIW